MTGHRIWCNTGMSRDPIQFLKNALVAFQGHDNLQAVDWQKFVAETDKHTLASLKHRTSYSEFMEAEKQTTTILDYVDMDYLGQDENMHHESFHLFDKAVSFYKPTSLSFKKWKVFITQRKSNAVDLAQKMDEAERHFERNCQRNALNKWFIWAKLRQNTKRLEMSFTGSNNRDQQIGGRFDGLSVLPENLSLKIFQYLDLGDWLNCSEVCCTWNSIIQSGALWSQINVSTGKAWITDGTVKQILQNYRPFVTHLNLRGCTSLNWSSLKYIGECRNLQELNMSECINVTDTTVQRITEGCPCLLYLNLSCTPITNNTLREVSRKCVGLQYLSLAYCCRFTDIGFLYLTTGTGGRSLIHLNLSGCTQMTVNGFRYISAACPSLRQLVINDMPTLSDSCILALLTRCCCLSSLSLLDAPHLSDVALKAIAETSNLRAFSIEGNNQLTDVGWKALCSSSQTLCRLHASECPRMTDDSLRSVATLENLQYLDISWCNRVSDIGIGWLTKGSSASKLQKLNVSHCSHITDISVKRIARRLCKLYHLNLSYCERLTDVALEWLSGSSVSSLDISGCNIQDQGLATLERICLKKIVLAECVYITDIGIEKLCKNARDLEEVDVSHCVALSDGAVRAFSFYCRGLVVLQIAGCPKVTDMAVQYLTSGSPHLRELNVSGCSHLTDRSLRYLERICPPLASISMSCCSGISRVAALKLQTRVSHWEYSSDDPSHRFVDNVEKTELPTARSIKTDDV